MVDIEKYLNAKRAYIIATLQEVADPYNATCAQIALAWLQAKPFITASIASVSTVVQLGVDIGLDSIAMEKLNKVSAYKENEK